MRRTIKLPCYGIVVNLDTEDSGAGSISSELHEERDPKVEGGSEEDTAFDRYDGAMEVAQCLNSELGLS